MTLFIVVGYILSLLAVYFMLFVILGLFGAFDSGIGMSNRAIIILMIAVAIAVAVSCYQEAQILVLP